MNYLLLVLGLFVVSAPALAVPGQSTGVGSAVTSVDTVANFEDPASLGAVYTEGGLTFTRVGISLNNNGCGFAGCSGSFHPFGFIGNYFYGHNTQGGYIQIDSATDLFAIEFTSGWGPTSHNFYWETYRDNVLTGSGTGGAGSGTVIGIADTAGFDRLLWTDEFNGGAANLSTNNAPAIDNVRAQFVPEPASIALLALGLAGLGFGNRKRLN
jgi:PEP-CTERM motif